MVLSDVLRKALMKKLGVTNVLEKSKRKKKKNCSELY
jgi:hypothetical protein